MKQKLHFCLIFLSFLFFTNSGFSQSVFINEFHYDNDGGDTNEGFEIAGPEGTNLDGYYVVLYNGNGGGVYGTVTLEGIIPNSQGGFGMLAFSKSSIQNGPDALALVDPSGTVSQFISYEAVVTATDGPANGMSSIDILVEESGSTPNNFSLQLEGEGQEYSAFTWVAPAQSTFGEINNNQDFGGEIFEPEPEPEPQPEPANSVVFINEFHYDNAGGDTSEGIEIAGTAGTDLSVYSIVLYNGADQEADNKVDLSGILPDLQNGYGTLEFYISGIQNGAPDGFALIKGEEVIQFLSYEGSFTAIDGPAAGITSKDVGVEESSSTAAGFSLQLSGECSFYEDFEWAEAASGTFGNINNNQTFITPEPVIFVNELHYDNTGGDTGEGIEIAGTAGTDLSAYSIVLYNGSDQQADDRINLSGIIPNQDNGYGTLSFPISGIQNGAPDGFALIKDEEVIQFLSYEGSFTAADGPAAGLLSVDIGVEETSSTEVGYSLQLTGEGRVYEDFVWNNPTTSTFGSINTGQSFGGEVLEPEPEPEPEITEPVKIAIARALNLGEKVIVEGILTVSDQLGSTAYIQDETGGMAIFGNLVTEEGLYAVGDSLRVTGIRAEFNGLIQISDLEKVEYLGMAENQIEPVNISVAELNSYDGQLVTLTDVSFLNSNFLLFGDAEYTIKNENSEGSLYIDRDTDLTGMLQPDFCSTVTGVIGNYRGNSQLIPRYSQDLPCAEDYNASNYTIEVSLDKTLDVATWNLEWFGASEDRLAPATDEMQKEAVKATILKLDADVIAVEEVSDEVLFSEMIAELEGYSFILSNAVSKPNAQENYEIPQQVGFIYKNSVISIESSKVLLETIHPYYNGNNESFIADYPTNDPSEFFSSGRLPFLINTTATIDGESDEITFVVIHAKANTEDDAYIRRDYDIAVLKDSLDAYYGDKNLMLIGDYNDDVDKTVFSGAGTTESTYSEFVQDSDNYWIVSKTLSELGFQSTAGTTYSDMIDHIGISNELFDNYITNSVRVNYELYDGNYEYTISDHIPVTARFILKELQIASLKTSDVLCSGTATGSATVNVSGGIAPYTYFWSDGQDGENATGLAAGDYSVEVTDALGTTVSQNLTIESTEPLEITIIGDQNINIGYLNENVILSAESISGGTAPYSYKWSTDETSETISVSPMETTIYSLEVTDVNGCSQSAEVTVFVTDVSCGNKGDKVQICQNGNTICVSPNAVQAFLRKGAKLGSCDANFDLLVEEIAAYPNPVKSSTTIGVRGAAKGKATLWVYDMNGNVRMSDKISLNYGESYHELNISNFISGVYIIQISKGNLKSQPLKIIKK